MDVTTCVNAFMREGSPKRKISYSLGRRKHEPIVAFEIVGSTLLAALSHMNVFSPDFTCDLAKSVRTDMQSADVKRDVGKSLVVSVEVPDLVDREHDVLLAFRRARTQCSDNLSPSCVRIRERTSVRSG